jgi:hypothetical protein
MRLAVVLVLGCRASAPLDPQAPLPDSSCADNLTRATGNQLVVDAVWRGDPVKVVIDTGAAISGISKTLAARHRLRVAGTTTISIDGKQVPTELHDVGTLQIGGVELVGNGFAAQTHPQGHDFILGIRHLLGHALVLDVEHRSFCLESSPHPLATVPLRLERGQLIVEATFGELALANLVLDTGAGMSALREEHIGRMGKSVEREQTAGRITPLVRIPELCVAGTCVQEQVMLAAPDGGATSNDGVLGVPLFAQHRLVIDFPARKFALVRQPRRE